MKHFSGIVDQFFPQVKDHEPSISFLLADMKEE